jgi:hypothetical protein
MADAGVPLHVLQKILGHASIETTCGYLHPDDRHLASAAERANAFLAKSADRSAVRRRRAGADRRAAAGNPAPPALAPPGQFGTAPGRSSNHSQVIGL